MINIYKYRVGCGVYFPPPNSASTHTAGGSSNSLRGRGSGESARNARRLGGMVMRSAPASARISSRSNLGGGGRCQLGGGDYFL